VNALTGQPKEDVPMNKNMFASALITAGLMMISPLSANAVSYQVSGMMCDSSFGDDTNARRSGLENNMSSKSIWVSCPVIKFGSSEDSRIQVNLLNNSNKDASVKCILNERYQGRPVSESEGTIRVRRNGFSDDMFWEGGFDEQTHANVICKLPPGTAIESLSFSTSLSIDDGNGPFQEVQACQTYAKESANPGVRFANGAVIENARGDTYYGPGGLFDPTQVILFKANNGDWYELQSDGVKRVSLLVEPITCFAPDMHTIEQIIPNEEDSGSEYVLSGGKTVSYSQSCRGYEVGDQLTGELVRGYVNLSKAKFCSD
jgi:hypothetical protein